MTSIVRLRYQLSNDYKFNIGLSTRYKFIYCS